MLASDILVQLPPNMMLDYLSTTKMAWALSAIQPDAPGQHGKCISLACSGLRFKICSHPGKSEIASTIQKSYLENLAYRRYNPTAPLEGAHYHNHKIEGSS
eukprot:TRINITY_DN54258_c0_g1_i1.p1 TRINITY_DN54258_c0_g1~~TRINITY_DN54258_c0_g1_i1.p1  ORF type:complete len:110 (+),score=5.43 TRINITY_DN54258_c0_g1_i1:30-332(+)